MHRLLRTIRSVFSPPRDPFARPDFDFLNLTRDDFLEALIRRRQVFDPRLKGENFRHWIPAWFRNSDEGFLLKAAEAYVRLLPGSLPSHELSRRLDLAVEADPGGDVGSTELDQYLKHRIALWDPKSHALGEEFHDRHIALCEAYAAEQLKRAGSWPPSKWLVEKLDPAKVEKDDYVAKLTCLMLPGDELWSYSSPPGSWKHMMGRAGIALLRDGKPISEIRTRMN